MKRTISNNVKPGDSVLVSGWVASIRDIGNIKFFQLRDVGGYIQVTAKKGKSPDSVLKQIPELVREDVISVEGTAIPSKQTPNGVEISPKKLTIISKSQSPLPIESSDKIESGLDKRLDWRPLDLRDPKNTAIFKVQSSLVNGMQSVLNDKGFLQVFTPCLMGTASESGADVFPVFYYNKEVYLRQDPQLHRELAIAAGFNRIYDLGPSWRAEKSHTSRHICEHRGIAPEMEIENDETDTIKLEQDVVVGALKAVKKNCKNELSLLEKKITIPDDPFPVLKFPKIYDILEKLGKKIKYGEDFDTESERMLGEWVKKKYNSDFFFVNNFPYKKKPFYVMKSDNPEWARSVDMIYKGTELSSGGQREHRYDQLIKQVKEKKMSLKNLEWFTNHFKYGVPPMGGFCIGIERFTMKLLDIPNIREAVLFARTPDRSLP